MFTKIWEVGAASLIGYLRSKHFAKNVADFRKINVEKEVSSTNPEIHQTNQLFVIYGLHVCM